MKILLIIFTLLFYLTIGTLITSLICITILKDESIEDENMLLGVLVVGWPISFWILIFYFIGELTKSIIYNIGKLTRNIIYKFRRK